MKYQVMPDLTPIEYEALKADIEDRGVLVAVELDEDGNVLDGHHRVRICTELGIADYPTIVRKGLTEEQKRNHARSLNVLRRHLSKEQRDEVMRAMRADGASYREIAQAMGVDPKTAFNRTSTVEISTVVGMDGKTRPATYERKPDPEPLPAWVTRSSIVAAVIEEDEEPERVGHATVADEDEGLTIAKSEPTFPPSRMAIHYSSETPEHYTPAAIIEAAINVMGDIDLDPCSNSTVNPNVPATTHYTIDDDGLCQPWHGRVYMNPPYGREIGSWVRKLVSEYEKGNVSEAIALVPGRIDTEWYRQLTIATRLVCHVAGRLTFIGNDDPAPFPSVVVYLGDNDATFYEVFSEHGEMWQRISFDMMGV